MATFCCHKRATLLGAPDFKARLLGLFAVLYQKIDPPLINGTRKPMKPGGYQDSGADIAFNLRKSGVDVVTPIESNLDSADHHGWSFPDTERGILEALNKGVTHLWANTILFASHPLQTSTQIGAFDKTCIVGQGPLLVERYDDKDYVNSYLRKQLAKPTRGRGSYGVKVCHTANELAVHLQALRKESITVMVEEYMAGEEATVTVMPPNQTRRSYWSLPVVSRFNHQDGIAPYNGVVAVTSNSRALVDGERDPFYSRLMRECEEAASALGTTAPIRIDARRFKDSPESEFALFDVNMKPNMTGPGRPGRDNQASLTLIAAAALGWDYPELLRQILETAKPLQILRGLEPK
ncbi:glutathione synthetase ATP-binding domain-like protein [Xylariaceae sp. FL0662B]|nr:glutathione synthetase ATP-binding domain-like protein [Xylariaceae sp. FL0662B]